jgi:hypothetical protein
VLLIRRKGATHAHSYYKTFSGSRAVLGARQGAARLTPDLAKLILGQLNVLDPHGFEVVDEFNESVAVQP